MLAHLNDLVRCPHRDRYEMYARSKIAELSTLIGVMDLRVVLVIDHIAVLDHEVEMSANFGNRDSTDTTLRRRGQHMNEWDVIQQSPSPRTRESLTLDLRRLGLEVGTTVLIHSSLSSLGWVCGGAEAVVASLMDVVTATGTLVMPSHTTQKSDPANWRNPPVPSEWWQVIRDTMPPFDPRLSVTFGMGQIIEVFRRWPDVIRSSHPQVSFAAWGTHAQHLVSEHSLDFSLGERSPLARIYDLDGWVMLLGVGHMSNTSFHLAEYRVPHVPQVTNRAPVLEAGQSVWRTYQDIDMDEGCFAQLGAAFERVSDVQIGQVGSAQARLFRQRAAVDFAIGWLIDQRAEKEP